MAVQVDTSLQGLIARWSLSRHDAAILRHALMAGSVVDWERLYLSSLEEVDQLLALNKMDLSRPEDEKYLRRVHAQALGFIDRELGINIGVERAKPDDLRELFLTASQPPGSPNQAESCMVLKVMNIVHHVNARDLQFKAPVSERDLAFMAHAAVSDAVSQMRSEGLPIVDFQGGMKPADSLLLKLLAKKDTLAAQVYDKVRYRVTVKKAEDIVSTMSYLFKHVLPFNYVIPGQSRNDLVEGLGANNPPREPVETVNEFSGPTYRQLNFIVDLPLRLDDFLCTLGEDYEELGNVMFVMVEFQIADQATAEANESGENRHDAYKGRQRDVVLRRLRRGTEETGTE